MYIDSSYVEKKRTMMRAAIDASKGRPVVYASDGTPLRSRRLEKIEEEAKNGELGRNFADALTVLPPAPPVFNAPDHDL